LIFSQAMEPAISPAQPMSTTWVLSEPADLPAGQSPRILIVDDEEAVRTLFAQYLRTDYLCATAASALEALALLAEHNYAVVISDVMMPGRSGIELLRDVTARYPDTEVIVASGIDRSQRVRDAMRLGAFDYLIKPCELDVLGLSVERAVARRSLSLQAREYKKDLERKNIELAASKSELERLQAQIIQSEKMASLGQLAAGVAHELNNPAGFIHSNMDLLSHYVSSFSDLLSFYDSLPLPLEAAAEAKALKETIDYEHLFRDLRTIVADCGDGAVRIRDVVQNLRTFSRLDEAELKRVDLHEGIESTIRLLGRYFGSGKTFLVRNYGNLPPVRCFAGQLNQVWMNLLVNAAQALREGGEVSLTTKVSGDMVEVAIADNGCGIDPAERKRIFDPFFTTKAVGEGTGLGLSISYGIVQRHAGTITVESHEGQGSTFTVRIPIEARIAPDSDLNR
jgi:two-component system, NtrC family, sensor kinase